MLSFISKKEFAIVSNLSYIGRENIMLSLDERDFFF